MARALSVTLCDLRDVASVPLPPGSPYRLHQCTEVLALYPSVSVAVLRRGNRVEGSWAVPAMRDARGRLVASRHYRLLPYHPPDLRATDAASAHVATEALGAAIVGAFVHGDFPLTPDCRHVTPLEAV